MQGEDYLILSAGDEHEGLALLALNHVQVILAVDHSSCLDVLDFLRKAEQIYSHSRRILLLDGRDEPGRLSLTANTGITHISLIKPIAGEYLRKHIGEFFTCHAAQLQSP